MKLLTQYKRENPDTVLGEKITIVQTYSSFNKEKIDKLEQYCKEHIGYGLVTKLKEENKPDCGNCKKSPYNINEAGECYLCWHGYSNKFEPKEENKQSRCNNCQNNTDELSGECYECVKGIEDWYEPLKENK